MAYVKSVVLLLSVSTGLHAFSVSENSRCCLRQTAVPHHQPPLCSSSTSWWSSYRSSLHMASSNASENDDDESPWYSTVSLPYAAALAVFIGFAAFVAPGDFGAPSDNAMIQAYIDNPASPAGLNPIFLVVFNLLGVAPLVLSSLVYPQASPKGLSPAPFLLASAAFGYGALGPYMVFRKQPRQNVSQETNLGWVVKNVLESKFFNWVVVALTVYQYYTLAIPLFDNPAFVWQDFVNLIMSSKFVSVSTLDLSILTVTAASLIPVDYAYRAAPLQSGTNDDGWRRRADEEQGIAIAFSTILLLPMLGASLYCALRPRLPPNEVDAISN